MPLLVDILCNLVLEQPDFEVHDVDMEHVLSRGFPLRGLRSSFTREDPHADGARALRQVLILQTSPSALAEPKDEIIAIASACGSTGADGVCTRPPNDAPSVRRGENLSSA